MFVSAIPVAYRPSFGDCQSDVVPAETKSCHIPRYDASASCLALSTTDNAVVGGAEVAGACPVGWVVPDDGVVVPELHAARITNVAPSPSTAPARRPPTIKTLRATTPHPPDVSEDRLSFS